MQHRVLVSILIVLTGFTFMGGCSSSSDNLEETVDVIDGAPRRRIDISKLGINAFVNDRRFGTAAEQFADVRNTLQLRYVRVLFNWDDKVQATPSSSINFSFYDEIISSLSGDMRALLILTNVPSWMGNSANWVDGNPRKTFVERWVRPVAARYGSNSKVEGFEIVNEPNFPGLRENQILGVEASPDNFVELIAFSNNILRELAPGKTIVSGATTAINQNFPGTIDYNRALQEAGIENFIDVWAIHYYGKLYENIVRPKGVQDFIRSLNRPVWVTESGEKGVDKQLAYGEEVWPFLLEKFPIIERIYIYQYSEASAAESTYGLRNLTPGKEFSDLYQHLKERKGG